MSTDRLLSQLLREPRYDGMPLAARVRRFLPPPVSFHRVGNALAAERPGEFVDFLLAELPPGPEMLCIEGEILRHRSVRDLLLRGLRARKVRPWVIAAQRPSPTARARLARRGGDAQRAGRGADRGWRGRSGGGRLPAGVDKRLKP